MADAELTVSSTRFLSALTATTDVVISSICGIISRIDRMISWMASIVVNTASDCRASTSPVRADVADTPSISCPISCSSSSIPCEECCVCSANLRISPATTANPRPASPARAASMDAFRDNRLVCVGISLIKRVISAMISRSSSSDRRQVLAFAVQSRPEGKTRIFHSFAQLSVPVLLLPVYLGKSPHYAP